MTSKSKGLAYFLAAAAAGTSVAQAQTVCNRPIGPDVIVGSLQSSTNTNEGTGSVANYSATATHDAFSMGTYSCNIGNVWLNWIAETNQHPVIGQNCYKYKVVNGSGRFEQLGQSWLKHGFAALSNNICCTGCAGDPTQDHLGVGCADPYNPSRNGGQSGAGPKWQVNAHTGVYPYPPASPAFSGSVARRLAIRLTDLEPSSASVQFFGEGQYVALDEATAGNTGTNNQNNNVSYRRVTVVAGTATEGFNFSFSAGNPTARETPAIHAWKVIDPAVTESSFQIPGDGLIYVSSRATDLGGGTWHYEFALYNMNSDRSIGTVSVPLPAAATVSNLGFRDVDYRDGDGIANVNIDGTDWPGNRIGDTMNWTTVPFAANANGNAIRWGTMYCYRFDADVAPVNGTLTVSTWKSAGDYQIPAQVPGVAAVACYSNCDGSTTVPCLNVADFSCFLNAFAAGESYANCDNSTTVPVLNVADFNCFLNTYAAGCSGC